MNTSSQTKIYAASAAHQLVFDLRKKVKENPEYPSESKYIYVCSDASSVYGEGWSFMLYLKQYCDDELLELALYYDKSPNKLCRAFSAGTRSDVLEQLYGDNIVADVEQSIPEMRRNFEE